MNFKVIYETVGGEYQSDEFSGSLGEAIEKAIEMTESEAGTSTMTWTVENDGGRVVASGTGNEVDETA